MKYKMFLKNHLGYILDVSLLGIFSSLAMVFAGYSLPFLYRIRMLMYGKEVSNRKQEIDRQHHTVPKQRKQRLKDKHCGKFYKTASYTHSHNADCYGIPIIHTLLYFFFIKNSQKNIDIIVYKCYSIKK